MIEKIKIIRNGNSASIILRKKILQKLNCNISDFLNFKFKKNFLILQKSKETIKKEI
jgi:antitoxin component of MazEF toxin-antitoxin module